MTLALFTDAALEPFRHAFMLKAMAVGLFVCVTCAVLSCFIVVKGWSLVGDAIAHAVLPGLIAAYLVGLPMALGAVASAVACVAGAGAIRTQTRIKPDALLGISFTFFLAIGLILLVAFPGDVHFMHVLFGNLLGMPNDDVAQAVAAGAFALAAVAILRKDLILFCFDPGQARVIGLSPARLELILLVLTSLTVVAALQAVGIVLVMAMLVTPGCVGLLLADRFGRVVAVAAGSAAMSAVAGSLGSFYIDAATGPAIVLAQAAQFALAFLLAPKRGLLMQRRRRLAAA